MLSSPNVRRRWILVPLLILSFGVALPAGADGPVLHELVPPDPNEDVSLAATTLDGNLPAALDTPSGVAEAPDPRKPPDLGHIYTGGTTDDSPDDTLEPDRDTRQPKIENYDDPFSPSTAPFKRLRAYDSVDERYTLRVARKAMSQVPIGGEVAATDEAFYGDMSVELLADDLVRVPSVGPGTRVIKMHVEPDSKVSLLADGADNWFLRGSEHKRVRVVMQLAIPRATFGSDFRDVDWSQLGGLPAFAHHPAEAEAVFAAVGINRGMRPKDVVGKMVEYFRAFVPTNEPLRDGGDVYKDVALSKKGVCRHRAFAFMVTALEIGIPARMVVNEAHAWVEVFDGELWHRIDLGGAALDLDQDLDPTRPQHKPPDDPYAWPDNQAQDNSGQRLADREHQQPDNNGTSDPSDPSSDPNGSSVPDDTSDPSNPKPSDPSLPASTVELELVEKSVKR
ncbi:MAG TPA: transglutaminase-like domain-containing protein, partial [Polyangiaceae bacterium]|nr:transglutaminase-like domain-containing protein [Polyangiaceae bacterium]